MKKIKRYFQETYYELVKKVSWPSMKDLQNSAVVVMVASLIIALLVFGMDYSFENLMGFIYEMLY